MSREVGLGDLQWSLPTLPMAGSFPAWYRLNTDPCCWQFGVFYGLELSRKMFINQQLALSFSWLLKGDAADQRQQEDLIPCFEQP